MNFQNRHFLGKKAISQKIFKIFQNINRTLKDAFFNIRKLSKFGLFFCQQKVPKSVVVVIHCWNFSPSPAYITNALKCTFGLKICWGVPVRRKTTFLVEVLWILVFLIFFLVDPLYCLSTTYLRVSWLNGPTFSVVRVWKEELKSMKNRGRCRIGSFWQFSNPYIM